MTRSRRRVAVWALAWAGFRPNGSSLQGQGIDPDIRSSGMLVPLDSQDPVVGREIPRSQIDPVRQTLGAFDPTRLPRLREQSRERQDSRPEFVQMRARAERLEQLRHHALVLNLGRRWQVRAEYATVLAEEKAALQEIKAVFPITPIHLDAPEDRSMDAKRSPDSFHVNLELAEAIRILADLTETP